jgi:hypothetical protein
MDAPLGLVGPGAPALGAERLDDVELALDRG